MPYFLMMSPNGTMYSVCVCVCEDTESTALNMNLSTHTEECLFSLQNRIKSFRRERCVCVCVCVCVSKTLRL